MKVCDSIPPICYVNKKMEEFCDLVTPATAITVITLVYGTIIAAGIARYCANRSSSSLAAERVTVGQPRKIEHKEEVRGDYGNAWLIEVAKKAGHAKLFTNYYASLITTCKEKFSPEQEWDLPQLFPERTVSARQVAQMSVAEILSLSPEKFFAIIDLISAKQALAILKNPSTKYTEHKYALYIFNKNLKEEIVRTHKACWAQPIASATLARAEEAAKKYKRTPAQLKALQESAPYAALDTFRFNLSETLQEKQGEEDTVEKWQKINKELFGKGLDFPITEESLQNLRHSIELEFYMAPEAECFRIRGTGGETPLFEKEIYYFPGSCVKQETKLFLKWLNQEISLCDQGKKNPLLLVASAYQRFLAIHPFLDGNGRTVRMLFDLILQWYGYLPLAWKDPTDAYFVSSKDEVVTPTVALERVLAGLDLSYSVVEPKKKEGKQEK